MGQNQVQKQGQTKIQINSHDPERVAIPEVAHGSQTLRIIGTV
jgi:hypothetical protein